MNRTRVFSVAASVSLALAACTSTPSDSPTSPSRASAASRGPSASSAKGLAPGVEGMDLALEFKEKGVGELADAVTDGKVVATIRNDLSRSTHTVTGYSVKTGKKMWTVKDEGWLECTRTSPIVCQTTVYEEGDRTVTDASILTLSSGKTVALKVGPNGKFVFAGTHEDIAYFLTWEGTEDIHMTGFDKTGAPVADKNLKISAPKSTVKHGVMADLSAPSAWVRTEDESGVYVAGRNGYGPLPVTGPCIAVRDGAVCQVEGGIVGVHPNSKEAWRIDTSVTVVPSSVISELTLAKAEKLLQGALSNSVGTASGPTDDHKPEASQTPSPSPSPSPSTRPSPSASGTSPSGKASRPSPSGSRASHSSSPSSRPSRMPTPDETATSQARPGEENYLVSLASGPGLVKRTDGGNLVFPGGGVVSLGTSSLVDFDVRHSIAVVNAKQRAASRGEASGPAVLSSTLADRRGKVLANLGADKANRILANASGGDILKPFTFAWQGDTLVFVDAVNGVVGVYTEK